MGTATTSEAKLTGPVLDNPKIDVASGVLRWARESINLPLETAAKRLGIKPETLFDMESGHRPVALSKLREMAKVYDRPLLAFFLPEPPAAADHLPDFRVVPDIDDRPWSPALHVAYRRAVSQRQIALDLSATDDESLPAIDLQLRLTDDAEWAGETVRSWLNPPVARFPRDQYEVLNLWVNLIERKGVLVTQVSDVSLEEMRGFSIGDHPLPVIALNGSDTPRGKVFTLMHELTHILLRVSALCDLEDVASAIEQVPEAQRIEWFCNRVAAAILMPHDALSREPLVTQASPATEWSDEDLTFLSTRFGVSREAMLLRLVTLGRASREFYRERRRVFLQQYREQRENSSGFLTYYPKMVRNLGRRYIATVWRAYERGDITVPDMSTYLNVKPQNVPKLIEEMDLGR